MSQLTSRDGTRLHSRTWSPTAAPRGSILLVHGYGEHIGRYDHVGEALVGAGFQVLGLDLRGHGKSDGRRGFIRRFDDYLDDVAALATAAAASPRPHFLVGHSLGGLVALHYALQHSDQLDGLVLSSPYLRLRFPVPKSKVLIGRLASRILPTLALPTGLRGSDVTRDPEMQRLYDSDPLNNKIATSRWFTEATAAQEALPGLLGALKLPLLVLQGAADAVADPAGTEAAYQVVEAKDKTLHLLEGQAHEIFNEPLADRTRTLGLLTAWLVAHS